jgi:hypothetical protein
MRSLITAFAVLAVTAATLPGVATAHESGEFIPGWTLAETIERLESLGLECETDLSPPGPNPPAGSLGAMCEGTFDDQGAQVTAHVVYWEDGHVAQFEAVVGPIGDGAYEDVSADFAEEVAVHLGRTPYAGADPDAAEAWIRENADNSECESGCSLTIGEVRFFMAVAAQGWPAQFAVIGMAETAAGTASPAPSAPPPPTAVPDTSTQAPQPASTLLLAVVGLVALVTASALAVPRRRP